MLLIQKFSVLLCTYAKENPLYLKQALDSLLNQTLLPHEIVIVKDGALTAELESVLADFDFPRTTVLALPKHGTLGLARAAGVNAAACEWVALMDSDDICEPDRFERQMAIIASDSPDIVGGQIAEFDQSPEESLHMRAVPVKHADIVARAKRHNPFNAMSVMFRRDLALSAGNFRYFPDFEDYDLWTRMIKNGAKCANSADILVRARIGGGMYARRRGIRYVRSEWRMQKQLLKIGIVGRLGFVRNVLLRIPIRLLPAKALEIIYKKFTRKPW
ncbi:MAG: glycosyltransferase [Defluviitaleaceae bacterium]|nr:glycosyltransferase [Defluviitaleaceae bacterium]